MVDWTGYANRLRVGKEWSASRQPSQADPSYPVTARVYQATNYEFYDYDGHVNWSGSFGSGSHTGRLSNSNTYQHATLSKTFTASYSGTQTFSLSISCVVPKEPRSADAGRFRSMCLTQVPRQYRCH